MKIGYARLRRPMKITRTFWSATLYMAVLTVPVPAGPSCRGLPSLAPPNLMPLSVAEQRGPYLIPATTGNGGIEGMVRC